MLCSFRSSCIGSQLRALHVPLQSRAMILHISRFVVGIDVLVVDLDINAVTGLIEGCSKLVLPRPGCPGIFYMGTDYPTRLSKEKNKTKFQMNFMIIVPLLLKVLLSRIVVDVDGLYLAPQGRFWRHVEFHEVQVHRPLTKAAPII